MGSKWAVVLGCALLTACGPTGDDSPLEPGRVHLNLQPGSPIPPLPEPLPVAGSPGDTIVAIAAAEEGRGPNQVGQDLTTYPFKLGNYLDPGEAWCSEFVSWAYRAANHPFSGGYEGGWMLKGSVSIRSWFQQHKTFVSKGSAAWSTFTPQPGDYIRYNTSLGGHSGIVHHVSGSTLYTVEGNVNNQVMLRTVSAWHSYYSIDGIGRLGLSATPPDAAPAAPDLGPPPAPDQGSPPLADQGPLPPPGPDLAVPARPDAGVTDADPSLPQIRPPAGQAEGTDLVGGCSVPGTPRRPGAPWPLLALLLARWLSRRA
jgi:hypothetical protein